MIRVAGFTLVILFTKVLCAETVLPDPLTLEYALSRASDKDHYQLLAASARLQDAQAEQQQAEAGYALEADIELQARLIEPSRLAFDKSNNDSEARLLIRKPLYDFGQTASRIAAAEAEQLAATQHTGYLISQRKIDITEQFFAVILADLRYAWDNEAMAIAFVRYDAAQERHALTRISDVDLLAAENRYQQIRLQRYQSENDQRRRRARLAETMNMPGDLAANLAMPKLDSQQRELPDYDVLLARVLDNNPLLKISQNKVDAAQKRIQAERHQFRPRLQSELELAEYARKTSSNDEWRAELKLTIPLFEDQAIKADISKARSQWLNQRAMLLQVQSNIRQQLLELWQSIQFLKTQREQVRVAMEFSELNLDRNRALYEMEVTTDLGDAMVAVSETRYRQAKTDFELALAWMQLDLLLGQKIQ